MKNYKLLSMILLLTLTSCDFTLFESVNVNLPSDQDSSIPVISTGDKESSSIIVPSSTTNNSPSSDISSTPSNEDSSSSFDSSTPDVDISTDTSQQPSSPSVEDSSSIPDIPSPIVDTLTFEFSTNNSLKTLKISSDTRDNTISYSNYSEYISKGETIDLNLIENLIIGENIANIEYFDFSDFTNLKYATFSSDIKEISSWMFYDCWNMESITFEGDAPKVLNGSLTFNGGKNVIIKTSPTSKGFDNYLFEGHQVDKYIFEPIEINNNISLDEYSLKAVKRSNDISKQIIDKANKSKDGYLLYYPFTFEIDEFEEIYNFTKELTKNLETEDEKIKAVYDYLVDNIVYDDLATYYNPYEVFVNKKAVCAGYTSLMHDMLRSIGIKTFYNRGFVKDSYNGDVKYLVENFYDFGTEYVSAETHAWLSVVKQDNSISYYDPTWGVMDKETFYNMSEEELANHVVTISTDFIDVTIDEIPYSNYKGPIVIFGEDDNIYVYSDGKISGNGKGDSYNFSYGVSYDVNSYNDGYLMEQKPEVIGSVYTNGLRYYESTSIGANYSKYDGKTIDFKKLLKYIKFLNKNGHDIEMDFYNVIIKDDCVYFKESSNNNTLVFYGYIGNESELVVPAYVDSFKVNTIGADSFVAIDCLKKITISEGVEVIHGGSFIDLKNLEEVNFPSTANDIFKANIYHSSSSNAFQNCPKLNRINVSSSNQHYYSENGILFSKNKEELIAFPSNYNAKSYEIPSSVKRLANYAFNSSKLNTIIINNTLESIGESCFGFSKLESIRIASNVEILYSSFSYCSYLKEVYIEDGIESIGSYAFANCQSLNSIRLPNTLKSISECMLLNSFHLHEIEIPSSVTNIEYMAFCGSRIVSLTLPSSLKEIGLDAFYACYALKEIYNYSDFALENGSYDYGSVACYAKDIYTSNQTSKIVEIGDFIFYEDALIAYKGYDNETISLPTLETSYYIEESAFNYSDQYSVITYGYESKGRKILLYSPMINTTTLEISSSVSELKSYAFAGCVNIDTLSISSNTYYFGLYCLGGCNINTINYNGSKQEYLNSPLLSMYPSSTINYINE